MYGFLGVSVHTKNVHLDGILGGVYAYCVQCVLLIIILDI